MHGVYGYLGGVIRSGSTIHDAYGNLGDVAWRGVQCMVFMVTSEAFYGRGCYCIILLCIVQKTSEMLLGGGRGGCYTALYLQYKKLGGATSIWGSVMHVLMESLGVLWRGGGGVLTCSLSGTTATFGSKTCPGTRGTKR